MERTAKVLESGKNEYVVLFKGMDLGVANWVSEIVCGETGVDFAASDYDHPVQCNPVLRVKGDSPKKSVLKAFEGMRKELKEFRKSLSK